MIDIGKGRIKMNQLLLANIVGGMFAMKNSTAIWVGVGIGVAISAVGIGCYCYYRNKNTVLDTEDIQSKKTKDLLNSKVFFENLEPSEIVEWFKANVISGDAVNYVVSKPIDRVLTGLGCKIDKDLYGEKILIQMIYDTEKKKAIKIRLIEYANIDTNLEAQIDESNGFMVVTL